MKYKLSNLFQARFIKIFRICLFSLQMRSVDDVVDVSADSVPLEEEAAQEKRPKYRMVRQGEEELDETGRLAIDSVL